MAQEAENGRLGNHDLQAYEEGFSELVLIQSWKEDFATLWNDAMDEADFR